MAAEATTAPAPSGPVLLTTKVHAPSPRRELVLRPVLVDRLTAGTEKLTLLAAPAGWGKTTMLAEWLAQDDHQRFAWLSVDRGDNDPARFWSYVVEALRTVEPELGAPALAQLRATGTSVAEVVLPALINEIAAFGTATVLVLDDFHLITTREIHDQIAFLVEHLPRSLRVAIATRSDPPLGLARLRARAEINEIRAEELRFTEEEAGALLNGVLGLRLDSGDVQRLQQRTEGWAAGLYLAALSLRGQADPQAFIEAFAGDDRHVVDYLGAEVLQSQEEAVQRFLLQTSILERLCAALCDAVTEGSGSAPMLEEIERSNLFLHSLDAKREWYRYHRLFSELLQHELRRRDPELVPALHRRAADWYRREGAVPEAIDHAVAAGEDAEAAELVARHWNSFFNQGRLTTVSDWLDALPEETVAGDPRLAIARAWIALDLGRLDEVEGWLAAAEGAELRGQMWDGSSSVESALAVLQVVHRFKTGDVGQAGEAAHRALDLESEGRSFGRTAVFLLLGATRYWSDELEDAVDALEEAARLARSTDNHLGSMYALGYLALARLDLGDLEGAENATREAFRVGDDPGRREHFVAMMGHLAEARILMLQSRVPEACASAVRAAELAGRGAGLVEIASAFLLLGRLLAETGDRGGARAAIDEARRALERSPDSGRVGEALAQTERRLGRRRGPAVSERPGDELSERELAVLRLLPTRLSQREIGASLYVSVNTVKTHTKSIFRKLGVSTRAEAVARARELGLV
jgi:LuxR family transcriptional regulator, maltose regulon positive regulatory protein